MPFQKGDKVWSKRPKNSAMKQARPPPKKKSKGKGKATVTEPSEPDEPQVGDALSEVKNLSSFNSPSITDNFLFTPLHLLSRMKTMKARRIL